MKLHGTEKNCCTAGHSLKYSFCSFSYQNKEVPNLTRMCYIWYFYESCFILKEYCLSIDKERKKKINKEIKRMVIHEMRQRTTATNSSDLLRCLLYQVSLNRKKELSSHCWDCFGEGRLLAGHVRERLTNSLCVHLSRVL